jgi:hypothetical protein
MVEAVNAEAEGEKLMSLTAPACPLPPLTLTQSSLCRWEKGFIDHVHRSP